MRIEHWWFTARLRLRSVFRRSRVEQELDEELQFHLAHKIEEGIAAGLSAEEARYSALRAMGGAEQHKEVIRDVRRVRWVTDFVDDARYAVRSLRRTPALAAFVAITLALGIGMTSASFSMVDALIFRPYPVPQPGRVMTLVGTTRDSSFDNFSYREYLDLRAKTRSYDGVIASADLEAVGFSAEPGTMPRVRGGMMVSGNYFRVLGVEPRLGRGFRDDEDRVPGRDAVVVLGPDFWKREFGSDPTVPGRTVRLNGMNFTVIGVAPPTFPGMMIFGHPDFYMPLAMARVFSTNPRRNFFEDRDDRELTVRARLKPGATHEQAESELVVLAKDFEREYPNFNRGRGAAIRTQFEMRTRDDDVNWKFGVTFIVLAMAVMLTACTNVAGLLLSRARARTREIAVRLALGAGRFRIIRLMLTESLMLAAAGGAVGIAVAYGIVEWFHSYQSIIFMSELPLSIPFRIDTRVLLASLALSAACALLCGLAPAFESTRADPVNGIKSGDADLPGRRRLWGRDALVVAQVSISLMLLTASFLMFQGFRNGVLGAAGFAKDRLLMAGFDPRLAQYDTARSQRFYKLLAERVRQAPGVEAAALTQNIPLGMDDFDSISFDTLAYVPDGFDLHRDGERFTSMADTVDPGYFATMGVAILRGRGFLESDTADAPRVLVVNEQFAKHYWPRGDAVGKRVRLDRRTGPPAEIVGVAQTIRYQGTTEKPTDFVYLPLAQHPVARMVLMVRCQGDPLRFVKPVKEIVRSLDPNLPMLNTRPYADFYVNRAVKGPSIAIELVGAMGVVGLLLAVAGLYGLTAYNVSRRTRELGIRIAIGAARSDVVRLVMGRGLGLVGIGTVIGLALGAGIERFFNSALFDSGGLDFAVYVVITPMLLLVTMLATYLPARRASRIAPTQALRHE